MSDDNIRLNIHSQLRNESEKPLHWKCVRKPGEHRALSFSDRLLRNGAIACGLLLAILALGNIDRPWAKNASETVERALTMHIDLDNSIGQLSFVRNIMPESALVFFHLNETTELSAPVDGTLSHSFDENAPWLLFDCGNAAAVHAVANGTVTLVTELSNGTWGIMVDHGSGRESVYAYLTEISVQSGDTVEREQDLGLVDQQFYFEWHENEQAVDPAPLMGLQT